MNQEKLKDLNSQHNLELQKITYFYLAIAASALAYSVKLTLGLSLKWSQTPLGIACLFWAASFYSGCISREHFMKSLRINFVALEAEFELIKNPSRGEIIAEIKKDFQETSNIGSNYHEWQFRLLIWGGLFFILWHLIEMIIKK